MKRDKIKLISEILKVSPMAIMGWEEGEIPNPAQTFPQLLCKGQQKKNIRPGGKARTVEGTLSK